MSKGDCQDCKVFDLSNYVIHIIIKRDTTHLVSLEIAKHRQICIKKKKTNFFFSRSRELKLSDLTRSFSQLRLSL